MKCIVEEFENLPRSFKESRHSFSRNVRYKCPGMGLPNAREMHEQITNKDLLPAQTSVSSNFCRNGECGSGSAR